jgi:ABC-type transport system involved in cytochrome bd biosynthesis fused ATPase/permease subunit
MTAVPWTMPVSRAPADHRRGAVRLVAPKRGECARVAATVALGATGQLASVGLLATFAWLITSASLRPPVLSLSVAIGAVQVFALLRGTVRYGERLASHDLALRVLSRTRVWAFGQLEPLIPGKWPKNRRGDLLARFVADVGAVQDLYVRAALPLLSTAATASLTVATAAVLDPMSGLVLGVGMVMGATVVPAVMTRLGARGGARLPALQGRWDALVVEAATGATEVQVFGAAERVGQELARLEAEVGREGRRIAVGRGGAQAAGAALSGLLVAGVMLVSLPALPAGRISGITVAVLGFPALTTAEPLGGLADGFAVLSTSLAAPHRVAAIEDASGPG